MRDTRLAEVADAADSKSAEATREGSTPSPGMTWTWNIDRDTTSVMPELRNIVFEVKPGGRTSPEWELRKLLAGQPNMVLNELPEAYRGLSREQLERVLRVVQALNPIVYRFTAPPLEMGHPNCRCDT